MNGSQTHFCELQALAREYKIDVLPFTQIHNNLPVDATTVIVRNPNKCVKCKRCVDVCGQVQTVRSLKAASCLLTSHRLRARSKARFRAESCERGKLGEKYSALFEKSGWSLDKDYKELEIDGTKCAVCANLGQVRKAMESKAKYGIIGITT